MDPTVAEQSVQGADSEPVAGPSRPNMNDREDVDSDARKREAMATCLGTPLIVHKMFHSLNNKELLGVARVNRLWKHEAEKILQRRSLFFYGFFLLRDQGINPRTSYSENVRLPFWSCLRELERRDVVIDQPSLIATMKERNTREVVDDFLNSLVLSSSFCLSLCGIYVKLGGQHGYSCQEPPANELNKFRSKYQNVPQATILAVHFDRGWDQHQNCPGFKLLKNLLDADRWHIRRFSLLLASKRHLFLKKALHLQDYKFKYLQILSFQDVGSYTTTPGYTNLIKGLVSCAPSLQTLCTLGCVDLNVNLLEGLPQGSQAAHVVQYPYSPSLDEIPENAVGSLIADKIKLIGMCEDFNMQRFNRITRGLLRASSLKLTRMYIDLPFLLPLESYGISLVHVQDLHIIVDTYCFYDFENQDAWNRIKSFDFNRILPNLSDVEIKADWESHLRHKNVLHAFMPTVGLMHLNPPPNGAVRVGELRVIWDADLGERSAQALAHMFPNTALLSITANRMVSFDVIWSSWLDLRSLAITLKGAEEDPSLNLDSVFLGIFPEEVAELRKKDAKYLKAVNIVPVMPSITNLKSLKGLSLRLKANAHSGPGPFTDDRSDFLLSKVTPLIAFRNLRASLVTHDEDIEKTLSHLKPYVSELSRI